LHDQVSRRAIWLPPALAILWLLPIFTSARLPEDVRFILLVYGEVVLPLVLGGIASGLLLNDPCRELLLAAPHPIWRVVLRRFGVLLLSAFCSWAGLLFAIPLLTQHTLADALLQIFFGGAVTGITFASIGLWAALQFRSMRGGGIFVGSLWAGALLFRKVLLSHPIGELIHPFLTLEVPESSTWLPNRLVLCAVAIVLIVLALRLTRNEELFLPNDSTNEVLE